MRNDQQRANCLRLLCLLFHSEFYAGHNNFVDSQVKFSLITKMKFLLHNLNKTQSKYQTIKALEIHCHTCDIVPSVELITNSPGYPQKIICGRYNKKQSVEINLY